MAVPKRKISPSKRNMRRSHDRLVGRNLVECQNCGEFKLSHQICQSCGYYKKKEVIQMVDTDEETEQDSED